jgi:hypothetical protein
MLSLGERKLKLHKFYLHMGPVIFPAIDSQQASFMSLLKWISGPVRKPKRLIQAFQGKWPF